MAVPTYVASGAVANLSASGTVALPAGIVANDILLLEIETANQAVTVSNQAGGTWAEVTNSPQGTGTAAGLTASRLTVFWSRYNGTQTAPTISDSGDHQIARIHAFRGCKTSGNPWNITSGNNDVSDTSVTATGATTTVPDCLVCIMVTLMDDAQDFGATWTNADLSSITVRQNSSGTAGNDGRHILVTGIKSAAGAYGNTTNTTTANSVKGLMTIALEPTPTAYSLVCDPVAVAVTVAAASLLKTSLLSAAAVSVALTAADSTLLKGSYLALDPPAVSITAADATLTYTPTVGYLLECEPVSVTITPADSTLTATRLLATDPVAVAVTAADANVLVGYALAADAVAVSLTAADADLERGYTMVADAVAVALTAADASLVYEQAGSYLLACDPVSLIATIADASLFYGRTVLAAPVTVTVTVADSTLTKSVPAQALARHVLTVSLRPRHTGTGAVQRRHGSSIMDTYTTDSTTVTTDSTHLTTDDAPMVSL